MTTLARPRLAAAVASGALLATGLLVPAPALAGGLTAASTLAPAGGSVVLATDGAGNAAAAWVAGGQVQVSRRTTGAPAWTPAAAVSGAGVAASDPDVAIGPDGTVAVAWVGTAGGVSPNVEIAMQPPGGAWVAARRVSDNENWTDNDPQVEVGPAGVATVVWAAKQNGTTKTVVRSKTAGATSISTQVRLSAADVDGTFSGLSLDQSPNGDTVAAWKLDGATGYAQASRRLSGAAWSTATTLTAPTTVTDATSVAIDTAGNASVGWAAGASDVAAYPYVAQWARVAGSPAAAGTVSAAPGRQVQVARSATGLAAVAWTDGSGMRYADGVSPAVVLAGGAIGSVSLSLSSSGAAAVAFTPAGGGISLATRGAPGSAWSTLPVPSAAWSVPAVSAHGADATLVWSQGGSGAVQAQTLDNSAPYAVHLTAPMSVLNKGKLIRAGWIGADTWSPITYEVERQVGTYRAPLGAPATWVTTTAIGGSLTAKPGETVCLRVRGADPVGGVSAWSVPRCASVAVDDKTLKQKKLYDKSVWKTVKKAKGFYSKTYTQSSRKGATLALRVKARRIALLVSTGRGHGSVKVSLGKDKLGTYSLASAKGAQQVVIPVTVFGRAKKGSLKITVTTNGKPVRIDGIYAGPA